MIGAAENIRPLSASAAETMLDLAEWSNRLSVEAKCLSHLRRYEERARLDFFVERWADSAPRYTHEMASYPPQDAVMDAARKVRRISDLTAFAMIILVEYANTLAADLRRLMDLRRYEERSRLDFFGRRYITDTREIRDGWS